MSDTYYYKHKEERLEYQKEYNQQNKEIIKIYQHDYYLNHRFKNTKRYKLQNIQKVVIVPSIVIKD
jgi:recombinational DNA repair protein (RecF pathway)